MEVGARYRLLIELSLVYPARGSTNQSSDWIFLYLTCRNPTTHLRREEFRENDENICFLTILYTKIIKNAMIIFEYGDLLYTNNRQNSMRTYFLHLIIPS